MSALPDTITLSPTGEELAKFLGKKDWDSIRKRLREQEGGKDVLAEKNKPLSPEAMSLFAKIYGETVYDCIGQNIIEHKQTSIIRKINTPQYQPSASREDIEAELKEKYKTEQNMLNEKYEQQLQLERQLNEQQRKNHEAEKQKIRDEYELKLKGNRQRIEQAESELQNLKDLANQGKSERSQIDKLYDAQKQRINQLLSEKSDLERQLEKASKSDVHQRIAQLRTSIESEYQQKMILALEEAKTDAATEAAKITAEIAAKHTAEILKIKADARDQVKKEVNIVTQNLKREIQEKVNIIRDKDAQLIKAYDEVGVDIDGEVPFTSETVKWASFTVIALAAALIFSKFESTVFKVLFQLEYENWLIYLGYFILAIVIQLLGVYISVSYNRKETEVLDTKTGKMKWVVTIEKHPIYVIVAMDIIVELVGFVWDFFDRELGWRFIIGAVVIAIILPIAHFFSSHIILEHLRRKIQERLNYGL